MKSSITVTEVPNGYRMIVSGRFGGGYDRHIKGDAVTAAGILRREIARYIDTNPDGGDYHAPPDVLDAMEAITTAPSRGARLSYYASPAALLAIQREREATGNSLSGTINALVLREGKKHEISTD